LSLSRFKARAALDEVFVFRLKALHSILAPLMYDSLKNRLATDKAFRQKYEEWVKKQGWTLDEERHRNIADQAAYILINKILFYKALERKKKLPSLAKKENVAELLEELRECFDAALKIDYRAVFQRDPIYDEIPLTPEVAQRLNILIDEVSEYDLSKMKRDVIGTLYEKLIPKDERRTLGQFYTPPQIVGLIVKMCVRNPDDRVLDPGCGSGGFLVASYDRLLELKGKTETDEETHQELLSQIWGVDINKFPAHLATINLANQNLESQSDHINVVISDFFDIKEPEQKVLAPWSTVTLDDQREEVEIPLFDAVVANPPYTRQEDIPSKQKENIRTVTLRYRREKIDLSARAGIYTYFFIHGAKFLKDGKRMGMIVSNSWLDVDYGGDLQRFFLDHFKVIAIIDADKRVFRDADVNTVVAILEKTEGEERKGERDGNLVKFVRLKTHMEIDEIIEYIEKYNEYFSDEKIRIYPKRQRDLWEEGFNEEEHRYVGSKWGKYIRAPEIYFKILEKGEDLFVPLKKVAEVRFGIKTGANEFFYLPSEHFDTREDGEELVLLDKKTGEERFRIEREFWMHKENGEWVPNYVIKSPRECKSIIVDPKDLKYRVLMIHKWKTELEGTNVLKYIEWGEKQEFHKRPTCASRSRWYDLTPIIGDILCMMSLNDRHIFWINTDNVLFDARLYGMQLKTKEYIPYVIGGILNSTLSSMFVELEGRVNLGLGALDVKVYEYAKMPIINPYKLSEINLEKIQNIFKKLSQTPRVSAFDEVGAKTPSDVSLNEIKSVRRALDDVIFDILELSEEEKLEVYRAVVDLVRRRLAKAEEIGVLVGPEIKREKPWPLSSKELEELVTLLQLSKVGKLTEEQEITLGRRAGSVVRDLAYEMIRLRHEPMSVNEVAQKVLDIGDDVLSLAGYYEVISEVMGGKATPKQVVRDLLSIWRDQPEGVERTISKLLSSDGRFLQIEAGLFGLRDWSPNELFQIYAQLVSKYRITDYEKKETFKGEAIRLLESGEVDFPDKDGLIQTLRRL